MQERSCLVVGAGISGLLAANELRNAGWRVTVLDKGRGVGGRMATRRVDGATFDHGSQFFTVREDRFQNLLGEWLAADVAVEWSRGFADAQGEANEDGHPRYRGSEGMTSIPKYLARDLDVRTGERVIQIDQGSDGWALACESGGHFEAGALLLTAPAPQSLELVGSGDYRLPDDARHQLEEISYDPCLALMVVLDSAAPVSEPGGVQIKDEPLDWIGDNQRKGISDRPGVTIHAGPQWSRAHYDDEETPITQNLLSFAGEQLDFDLASATVETSLHRWRYSWVTQPHSEPHLLASEDPPLLFCGDGFGKPKVEGAALSGLSAADRLLERGS